MSADLAARLLILLIVANGAPILARRLLGDRLATPIDMGLRLADGHRILGPDKTWRGIAAALLATAAAASVLGLNVSVGAVFAAASMAGDLLSSLVKRRLRLAPGRNAPVLDQGFEAALPLLAAREHFSLEMLDVLLLTATFTVVDLAISPLLRRLGIRRRQR